MGLKSSRALTLIRSEMAFTERHRGQITEGITGVTIIKRSTAVKELPCRVEEREQGSFFPLLSVDETVSASSVALGDLF